MVHIEEKYQLPRDFEGFGEEGFDPKWPNGARIAVSFVLNYEEGGERSILDGGMYEETASSLAFSPRDSFQNYPSNK